jgi:hypothetical protein
MGASGVRQGECRYIPGWEDGFLVVSATTFNALPGNPVVWGVPGTSDGYAPMRLTHLDRTLVTDRVGPPVAASTVEQVLRFVHWAFVGDGAFWDATPEQRQAHEAALGESDEVDQGDVVVADAVLRQLVIIERDILSLPPLA